MLKHCTVTPQREKGGGDSEKRKGKELRNVQNHIKTNIRRFVLTNLVSGRSHRHHSWLKEDGARRTPRQAPSCTHKQRKFSVQNAITLTSKPQGAEEDAMGGVDCVIIMLEGRC